MNAQDKKIPYKEKVVRNNWAIGMMYTESGFGLSATYFSRLARTTDLTYKFSVAGVTDESEIDTYDYYGNSFVIEKSTGYIRQH